MLAAVQRYRWTAGSKAGPHLALGVEGYDLRWCCEIDQATESLPTILRECRLYAEYCQAGIEQATQGCVPRLCWPVADEARAERIKAAITRDQQLPRAGDWEAAYREANDRLWRQLNLAFFKRLLLSDEGEITGELAPPCDALPGEELRRAVVSQGEHQLEQAVSDALRQRDAQNDQRPQEPDLAPMGAEPPALASLGGFSPTMTMRPSGLEPPRTVRSTRPSTLRVYQFRHGRRETRV